MTEENLAVLDELLSPGRGHGAEDRTFPDRHHAEGDPSSIAIDVKFSVVEISPPPAALAKAAAELQGKAMSVAARNRRFAPSTMLRAPNIT